MLTNRKAEQRQGHVQLVDATKWFTPLRRNLGQKNCELSEADIDRITDDFMAFEETEQSKIFPNAAFGYWKVTVERPLRIAGTDPERIYKASEISKLRKEGQRDENTAPIIKRVHPAGTAPDPLHGLFAATIKRIHPAGTTPDPLHGLFAATIKGKTSVVEYEPDPDLRDTEQIPLLEDGGVDAFLRREVLPYAEDAWYTPLQRQDRLRDQLQPPFLQATAHATSGQDSGRHHWRWKTKAKVSY